MSDQLSNDLSSLRIDRSGLSDAPSTSRKWLIIALAAAVTLAIGAVVYARVQSALFKTEVQLTEVSLVSPMSASTLVTATGYVQALKRTEIGARAVGVVSKLHVAEGSTVKAGDVLVELESADKRRELAADKARVAMAVAKLESAKANALDLETQLKRNRTLVDTGAVNQSVVDELEQRATSGRQLAHAAAAELDAAKATAEATALGVSYLTITAPISGRVITRPVQVGERVIEQSILELADMSSLVIEVDVPEGRLGSVKMGAPAEIVLDAYSGERRRGEVVEMGSKVNRSKATVIVRVKFVDDTTGVLPEMAGRVSFLREMPNADSMKQLAKLIVPKSAVATRDGAAVVFTVQNEHVRMQSVNLGAPFGDGFEIAGGLAAGTKLVRNPSSSLVDGQKIKER